VRVSRTPRPPRAEPARGVPARQRRPEPKKVLAFLAHLANEFTAVLKMTDLIERVVNGLEHEVGFESCTIGLIDEQDPDALVLVGTAGLRRDARGLRIPRGRGLNWLVIEQNAPLHVPDMRHERRQFVHYDDVGSGIFAPLVVDGRPIGVLSAHRREVNAFTQVDLHVLSVVAQYLGGAFAAARLHEQVLVQAVTDALTGVLDRRAVLEACDRAIVRHQETHRACVLALVDVDRFKHLNDRLGHVHGDAVLVQTAAALQRGIRPHDIVGRFGGDEFIVLLPQTDERGAARILEPLREITVTTTRVAAVHRLSLSWGLAVYPRDGGACGTLIAAADARLYESKNAGRG